VSDILYIGKDAFMEKTRNHPTTHVYNSNESSEIILKL
jgi:hypothetical protein